MNEIIKVAHIRDQPQGIIRYSGKSQTTVHKITAFKTKIKIPRVKNIKGPNINFKTGFIKTFKIAKTTDISNNSNQPP